MTELLGILNYCNILLLLYYVATTDKTQVSIYVATLLNRKNEKYNTCVLICDNLIVDLVYSIYLYV